MLKKFLVSEDDFGSLILRLGLGIMIFPHGAQKLLGWYGGNGFSGTMNFFTENMGIPWIFALLAILAEFFGGIMLVTGLGTRLAAFGVGFTMLVAAFMVALPNGFFMNWSGTKAGEGYEFHILAVAMAAALVLKGSGRWGLDRIITAKMKD